VTVLRPSNLYGPGQSMRDGFGLIRTMLEHARQGTAMQIWGDGESVRDFLYIDDLVEACYQVLEQRSRGWEVFNVGAGDISPTSSRRCATHRAGLHQNSCRTGLAFCRVAG
jgi:UDP-glucose 4-epimerase